MSSDITNIPCVPFINQMCTPLASAEAKHSLFLADHNYTNSSSANSSVISVKSESLGEFSPESQGCAPAAELYISLHFSDVGVTTALTLAATFLLLFPIYPSIPRHPWLFFLN